MNDVEKWAAEYLSKNLVKDRNRSRKEWMERAFMSGARKMKEEILKNEMICCDRIVTVERIKEIGSGPSGKVVIGGDE